MAFLNALWFLEKFVQTPQGLGLPFLGVYRGYIGVV